MTSARRSAGEMATNCLMSRSRMVARDLTSIYDDELRPVGVQASQLTVLAAVAHMGPIRRNEVGKALHLDASTLTRNLRVMEQNGWIEEKPLGSDGRGRPIGVTDEGAALLERAFPAWRRAQRRAARLLGDDGRATLLKLTGHLPAS